MRKQTYVVKLTAVIGPAVRQFVADNRRGFLDAECQKLLDNISELESKIRHGQERVTEKKSQLTAKARIHQAPSLPLQPGRDREWRSKAICANDIRFPAAKLARRTGRTLLRGPHPQAQTQPHVESRGVRPLERPKKFLRETTASNKFIGEIGIFECT